MHIAVVGGGRSTRSELRHQILSILPDADTMETDSGVPALELSAFNTFDVLFLDTSLDDMEGATLATAAPRMMPDAKVISAAAYSDYTAKAFELGIYNYILRPFDPERLKTVLEKCVAEMDKNTSARMLTNRIAVNTNRKAILLDVEKIAYIETLRGGRVIHSQEGDYVENVLLEKYEKKLAPYGFSRIHENYLINPLTVSELFPWASNGLALRMQGFENDILPVARDKVRVLRQVLNPV